MLEVTGDELIEAMADAVFIVNSDGTIGGANAAAERATGYSKAELAQQRIAELIILENANNNRSLSEWLTDARPAHLVAWLDAKQGTRSAVSVTTTPIRKGSYRAILVVAQTAVQSHAELASALTEAERQLAQLREQRVRSERLATLGRLAGGVGHELRNIAQLQVLALEALSHELATDNQSPRSALSDLERTTEQVAAHAQRLLKLAHPAPDHTRQANLAEIVPEVLAALNGAGKLRGIRVDLGFGDEPLVVAMSKARLEQVVWSLALNAVEAIGKAGGTLRVAVAGSSPDRVAVEITDSGTGIAAEPIARIFEPFFTTKPGATGLGLPVAKEIIEGHGGQLAVVSTADTGTTLRFDVPRI